MENVEEDTREKLVVYINDNEASARNLEMSYMTGYRFAIEDLETGLDALILVYQSFLQMETVRKNWLFKTFNIESAREQKFKRIISNFNVMKSTIEQFNTIAVTAAKERFEMVEGPPPKVNEDNVVYLYGDKK